MNIVLAFIIGLTSGGLSCLAVQGGLLASLIVNSKQETDRTKQKAVKLNVDQNSTKSTSVLQRFTLLLTGIGLPIGLFLIAKLISHTILGFLLGLLGSTVTVTTEVKLLFQTLTALYMLASAAHLLELHPIFRYVVIKPPKFIFRYLKNSAKSSMSLFAPVLLGLLTVFVPCGVTQSIEVAAINSGNPVTGALLLFFFVLGTVPLFVVVGVLAGKMSTKFYRRLTIAVASILIVMALYTLNGVFVVLDAPVTLNKIIAPLTTRQVDDNNQKNMSVADDQVQYVTINITNKGYQPNRLVVKKGLPVQLTLKSSETYTCALAFVFKEFGIDTFLKSTDTQVFTFTPNKKGTFTFTCSMGMYSGVMEVK